MSKTIVAALYGESGCGKTAIRDEILRLRPEYHKVVGTTTRPIRDGEEHGKTYYFRTDQEFFDKTFNGEMLEATSFNNWMYGTEIASLDKEKINIIILNPEGLELLNEERNIDCINIYLKTSPKVRLMRSLMREKDPDVDEIVRRYLADKKDFKYIDVSDVIEINNDGEETITDIAKKIISFIDVYLDNLLEEKI